MDIKTNIKKHGFTISKVADALGVTQSALSQTLNNNTVSLSRLEQVADIMGITVSELVNNGTTSIPPSSPGLVCPHCGKPISVCIVKDEE